MIKSNTNIFILNSIKLLWYKLSDELVLTEKPEADWRVLERMTVSSLLPTRYEKQTLNQMRETEQVWRKLSWHMTASQTVEDRCYKPWGT